MNPPSTCGQVGALAGCSLLPVLERVHAAGVAREVLRLVSGSVGGRRLGARIVVSRRAPQHMYALRRG